MGSLYTGFGQVSFRPRDIILIPAEKELKVPIGSSIRRTVVRKLKRGRRSNI